MKILDYFFDYPGYRLDDEARNKALDFLGSETLSDRYFSLNSLFNSKQKDALYSSQFKEELKHVDSEEITTLKQLIDSPDDISLHNKLIRVEMKNWLPNYLLEKGDKIAMSESLEQRYPFLDHELVEFAARIPEKINYRNGVTKYILRKVSENWLPKQITNRKKGPMLVPINKCFHKSFKLAVNEYLSEDRVKQGGYYNYREIKRLINNLNTNPFLYQRQVFALLTLEIWKELYS